MDITYLTRDQSLVAPAHIADLNEHRLDPRIKRAALIALGLAGVYAAYKITQAELVTNSALAIPLCIAPFLILFSAISTRDFFPRSLEEGLQESRNPI